MKILIPMAGRGQRFLDAGYDTPKPLIVVDGKTIIEHVILNFSQDDDFAFGCNEQHLKTTNMEDLLRKNTSKLQIIPMPYKKEGPIYGLRKMINEINDDEKTVVNYCDFSWKWDYNDFKNKIRETDCDGAVICYKGFHPHLLGEGNYATLDSNGLWMKEIKEKHSWHKTKFEDWSSSGTYYFKKGAYLKKYLAEIEKRPEWKINGEFYVSQLFQLMKEDGLNIYIYEIPFMLQWGTPQDLEEYNYWSEYFNSTRFKDESKRNMNVVIPMAGAGSRFSKEGYDAPKPLIKVDDTHMVIRAVEDLPKGDNYSFILRKEHTKETNLESILRNRFKNTNVIPIDYLTEGQACTVLLAKDHIHNNSSLLIGACDNGMTFNANKFNESIRSADALIFTFRNNPIVKRNPQMYGWVKVDKNNKAINVSVKVPISDNPIKDHAVVGSFWFKRGSDFVSCTEEMIKSNDRINNEFYVDNSMNYLIKKGLNVYVFEIDKYICWGTPNELKTYEYWQRFFESNLKTSVKLSIVVPCYNEEKNIPFIVERFSAILNDRKDIELVLVDNGSSDKTGEIIDIEIKKHNLNAKKVIVKQNQGYGFGILSGLNEASGDVLSWTHADLQTDPEDVLKAYELYNGEAKIHSKVFVKGHRKNRKLTEKFFSFGMQILSSLCIGVYLSEVNAQPKLFSREFYKLFKSPPYDFSLDLYVLYLAKKNNYKIFTLPVYFKDRIYGEAKGGGGSDLKTKWKLIKRTFKYILELKEKIQKGEIV
jgi:NDP-sugar pyrophosphorylase family protein